MPWVTPNDWYWQNLNQSYRIPLRVIVNNQPSAVDTFYIVEPQTFGTNTGVGVIGSGGAWGLRSRRGAMIVDNVDLNGGTFTIDTSDCDPETPGNQGFLPAVILSMKSITLASGSAISVNAQDATVCRNGGPGGGGGGTESYNTNGWSGNAAGAGYTGGGAEHYKSLDAPGTGTGQPGSVYSGGFSLNGAPGGGGAQNIAPHDSAGGGGGTGHPFGSGGSFSGGAGGHGGGSGLNCEGSDCNGGGGGANASDALPVNGKNWDTLVNLPDPRYGNRER